MGIFYAGIARLARILVVNVAHHVTLAERTVTLSSSLLTCY